MTIIARVTEGSTIPVRLSFLDRDQEATVPDSVHWALVDATTGEVLRAMSAASETVDSTMTIAVSPSLIDAVTAPFRLVNVEVKATLSNGDAVTTAFPVRVYPLGSI